MTVQELQQDALNTLAWLKAQGYRRCYECDLAGTASVGEYAWRRRIGGVLHDVLLCEQCVPKCEHKDCGNLCLLGTEGNCAEHEEMENRAFTEAMNLCEMRAKEVA